MSPELAGALPALILIFLVSSVIQGATGFGFGLFAVAALSLFVELKVATPLLSALNAPVILYVLWRLRHHIRKDDLGPIIVGTLAGIPLGTAVLVKWPDDVLLRVLAVVLLLAAARSLRATSGGGPAPETASSCRTPKGMLWGGLVGLATGALGGAFNTGGPPVIAYVYCRPWTKEQRTATLQAIFAVSVLTRIGAYVWAGLYDGPILMSVAACMPGAIAGMFLGYALFRRFPPRALELFVAVFLALVAVKLMIWP